MTNPAPYQLWFPGTLLSAAQFNHAVLRYFAKARRSAYLRPVKRMSCRLRRHKWKTVIEHGEEFRVCEECGKQDIGGRDATLPSSRDLGTKVGGPTPTDKTGGGIGGM